MFQPIRSTLSSDTSLVILCWSSRVSQTSFLGGTSSGRPFSGQQTINIKTFNTLFFCWGIFSYVTLYHCYRVMLQKVLQIIFNNIYWFVLRKYQSRERNFHLHITLTQQNPKILVQIPKININKKKKKKGLFTHRS